jgi:hypothetical protein
MDLNKFGPCKSYAPVGRKDNALCSGCWWPKSSHVSFYANMTLVVGLLSLLTFMVLQ